MKKTILILLATATLTARAQWAVIDPAVLAQTILEVETTTEQLDQLKTEVQQLGNPASIIPVGSSAIIQSLGQLGVVKDWTDIRGSATAIAAMNYGGDGLYRVIGEVITNADGLQFKRNPETFRKFDAVVRAAAALEGVMADTDTRRQKVRADIKTTTESLQTASTLADVQKLQATLAAQSAELAAIDREREAAMNWVVTQHISDANDADKQKAATQEERIVDFQSSEQKLTQFLTPDTAPVQLPDPRVAHP
jgi:uncharacterized membrane-anchored protein YhcB (DUF1043 family)